MAKYIYAVRNVIGIGASAGGLEPLQQILKELPDRLPNTTIIIAQHTSPNYESMLVGLLRKNTQLSVFEAEDGLPIEPNTIYTCPPDTDVQLISNKFKFSRPTLIGPKPSVDKLFISLAKAYKDDATGIIISGTGHDGTQGIAEIKRFGGFTIAQDPETASYGGMPDSAIMTDLIDLIISPSQIGREIPKLLEKDYKKSIQNENDLNSESKEEVESVKLILELLHQKTGTDFSGYKTSTIHRRLEKRIHDKKYTSVEDYVLDVQDNPKELDQLFLYLLIGVTQFYRNPESIDSLSEIIKTDLIRNQGALNYRIWVPGCATGEEAYTIAMIIDDLIKNGSPKPSHIQIFATDIDQTPLNKARIGRYSKSSLKELPQRYLDNYFVQNEGYFTITQDIKKYILFSKHDLTSNPPFLRLNLVSCRNLLIYFKTSLQNQILPLFHYTLELNGILFLGKSESVGRFKNLFETIDIKHKVYRKRQVDTGISHTPLLSPMVRPKKSHTSKNLLNEVLTVSDMVKETFYNGYEHPYIVVDDGLNVIEINKDISFYLTLPQGTPNLNAIKLIHKDLRLDLRTLVGMAHNSLGVVYGNYRKLRRDQDIRHVRLKVQPTIYSKPKSPFFIVSFEKANQELQPHYLELEHSGDISPIVIELEQELATTKEHLNTLVEELETSNEELQSLNEEMQSSNEELQASNEELETSNEELQATNEELNIAYNELRTATHKIEEQSVYLSTSQNNLKSVLDNTQQAFILISRDYNVLLFNNYALSLYKELFNVRLTEGVMYIDILPSEYLPKFHSKFKEALKGKQSEFEQEIIDNKGQKRFLSLNYTPVESSDNKSIENVSLSFIDITDEKNYELALTEAYRLADDEGKLWKRVFENSPELIAIFTGADYTISFANKSYKSLFPKRDLIGKTVIEAIPEIAEQGFVDLMNSVRKTGREIIKKEVPAHIDYNGTGTKQTRYFNFSYSYLLERDEKLRSIVLHAIDVTNQVEQRTKIEQEYQSLVLISETLPEQVWVLCPDGKIEFVNESTLEFLGLKKVEKLETIERRIHTEDVERFRTEISEAITKSAKVRLECRIKNARGNYCWHMIHCRILKDESGALSKLIISATDINEQKIAQRNKDDFMGVASHELKTPLTSVKAYTQLLQDHLVDKADDTSLSYLARTTSGILKLEKFVADLLDISRIQRGKLTLLKSDFSLTALINEVVSNLQLTSKSHTIITELFSKDIIIHADRARIEQVLVNLINNAIKYSPKSNEVIISLKKKIDEIEISVQDYGLGISKGDLKNVFDRFYRVNEHQNKYSGLGIGLNISKEIVHLHDGEIWVESKLGEGSIFYVTIPTEN